MCIEEIEGRCEAVVADARSWTGADPSDPIGHRALASALHASGASLESVEEALRHRQERESGVARDRSVLDDAMRLALARGDFVAAEEHAHRYEALAAS